MGNKNPMRVLAKDKPCIECGIYPRSGKDSRYCTLCSTKYMHLYRERHPELKLQAQSNHRKRTYGLSDEQYDALYRAQGGLCAACGGQEKLVVDHDHATGKVRALLCHGCNAALGYVQESQERLQLLVRYLNKYYV
jgi:hypothetical protein